MQNKEGFTLVELLAVIVVLAIIVTIAVPSTIGISKHLKNKMFCSKIDFIENAAKLYGENKRDSVQTSETIKVIDLVNNNYLKKDNNSAPYIKDPRDKNKNLDDLSLTIYKKYNRFYVNFEENVNNICNRSKFNISPEEKPENNNTPIDVNKIVFDSSFGFIVNENYIYTNTFNDSSLILSKLNYAEGSLSIENNILNIKSDSGNTKSLKIVSLTGASNKFFVGPNDIRIASGTSIEEFKNGITCTNCQIEIKNYSNNTIENSGNFASNYYYKARILNNDANGNLIIEKNIIVF